MSARRRMYLACALLAATLGGVIVASTSGDNGERRPVGLLQKFDCSKSMEGALPDLKRSARRITIDGARPGSAVLAGVFSGDPGAAPDPWPVSEVYPQPGNGAEDKNVTLVAERALVRGERVAEDVAGLLPCTKAMAGEKNGTPLLSVLAHCADEVDDLDLPPGAERRIVIYTDGAVIGDGLDIRRGITKEQLRSAAGRFDDRLKRLKGVRVWMIGVGSGTTIDSVQFAILHDFIDALVADAGGELVGFAASDKTYPLGR